MISKNEIRKISTFSVSDLKSQMFFVRTTHVPFLSDTKFYLCFLVDNADRIKNMNVSSILRSVRLKAQIILEYIRVQPFCLYDHTCVYPTNFFLYEYILSIRTTFTLYEH